MILAIGRCVEFSAGLQDTAQLRERFFEVWNVVKHVVGNNGIERGIVARYRLHVDHLMSETLSALRQVVLALLDHPRREIGQGDLPAVRDTLDVFGPQPAWSGPELDHMAPRRNLELLKDPAVPTLLIRAEPGMKLCP